MDIARAMFCPVCSHVLPHRSARICDDCRIDLRRLSYGGQIDIAGHKIHAGFRYQSTVRSLVLRAKVKNEVAALVALISSLSDVLGDQLTSFNDPQCLTIAAPSSLWSRITGRFDVARLIANTLFPQATGLDKPWPGSFWRVKRAGRNDNLSLENTYGWQRYFHDFLKKRMNCSFEFKECIDFQRKISTATRILVIDDVLTTGLTMGTLFNQLKTLGAQKLDGLVLAAADQA